MFALQNVLGEGHHHDFDPSRLADHSSPVTQDQVPDGRGGVTTSDELGFDSVKTWFWESNTPVTIQTGTTAHCRSEGISMTLPTCTGRAIEPCKSQQTSAGPLASTSPTTSAETIFSTSTTSHPSVYAKRELPEHREHPDQESSGGVGEGTIAASCFIGFVALVGIIFLIVYFFKNHGGNQKCRRIYEALKRKLKLTSSPDSHYEMHMSHHEMGPDRSRESSVTGRAAQEHERTEHLKRTLTTDSERLNRVGLVDFTREALEPSLVTPITTQDGLPPAVNSVNRSRVNMHSPTPIQRQANSIHGEEIEPQGPQENSSPDSPERSQPGQMAFSEPPTYASSQSMSHDKPK